MAATTAAFEAEIFASVAEPINRLRDPSFESGTAIADTVTTPAPWSWSATSSLVSSSAALETGWAYSGSYSARVKATNGATGISRAMYLRALDNVELVPVSQGVTYTMQAWGNLLTPGVANVAGMRAAIFWYKADGSASATPNSFGAFTIATGPVLSSVSAVPPADAALASVRLALYFNNSAATNYVLDGYWDAAAFFIGTAPVAYFDGNTPGNAWAGQGNNSISGVKVGFANPACGLMQGANYKLRQAYLAGITDPAAHTLAKSNPRQLKALQVNGKLASFDAITAP